MDLLKAVLTSPSPVPSLVGSAMLHCGVEEAQEKESNVCVPYRSLNKRRISVKTIRESISTTQCHCGQKGAPINLGPDILI